MFKKFKNYFVENIDVIAAGMAVASGSDYRPFIEN